MKLLGIDPSLNNFGYAMFDLKREGAQPQLQKVWGVKAPPEKQKTQRKNSQDLERAHIQFCGLRDAVKDVDFVMIEVPHGSQSARAMASYGICIGVLSSIYELPIIELTARDIKMIATGKAAASKEEIISKMYQLNEDAGWSVRQGSPAKTNEHMADACAAVLAGLQTSEFESYMAIRRRMMSAA